MGMSLGAYELNHECEYTCFIIALIHRYRCFISILTRLYLLNVLN